MKTIRQGDVLLVPVAELPVKTRAVPAEEGRRILARGEATGHHHSVPAIKTTALLSTPNRELYLLVQEGETLLTHQEHAPLVLAPGKYKVVIQREYVPPTPDSSSAWRRVLD